MKNKLFFVVYTLVVFFLGALVSFAINYPSSDNDPVTQTNSLSKENHTPITAAALAQPTQNPTNQAIASATQLTAKNSFNAQQFSQEKAQQILNSIPDNQLNSYVERFMSAKDAELIADKRQFANRAIEELYKQNDSQPLIGQVLLSDSSATPSQSISTNTLQKRQKLYAHLNTFGKVPLGANVFVKWTNRNTGEVLLFEKKLILPNSDNNWVSFQPYDSWQTGSYDIRFYQFTSQLEPVAQVSYDVNQVID